MKLRPLTILWLHSKRQQLIITAIAMIFIVMLNKTIAIISPNYQMVQKAQAEENVAKSPKSTTTTKELVKNNPPQKKEQDDNKNNKTVKNNTDPELAQRETSADFAKPTKNDDELANIVTFSKSEIELLQSLRKRREELDKKAEAIDQRERTVAAIEATLDGKIKAMEEMKIEIEAIYKNIASKATELNDKEDKQIASLIRIYEKMKPESAAAIFNNLELTILLHVVRGMNESKLAPILSKMDVKKATFITAELAKHTPIPKDAKALMTSMNTTQNQGTNPIPQENNNGRK